MARPKPPTREAEGCCDAAPGSATRRLIWIPIVHTQADLGSLGESIRDLYARRYGTARWEERLRSVEELWERIRDEIARLDLDYGRVRLYQDGLPNCGHEAAIVRDLAQAGSQNHQLLAALMARGARIMGTESPELLIGEYELMRGILGAMKCGKAHGLTPQEKELSTSILQRRDRHIAERINATLCEGETGLLFLGMLHSVEGLLPATVQVVRLFSPSLPGLPRVPNPAGG